MWNEEEEEEEKERRCESNERSRMAPRATCRKWARLDKNEEENEAWPL
jgi:hypothetical protein